MATRIRLQRHGKKGKPFFHIVAADQRAPRDGKYIERLGVYNPNTNPAIIEIDFERTLHWVKVGAQPSDTVNAMLKYKGVMYKNHLDKGVLKGAFTQEQAEAKFEKWMADKDAKIQGKVDGINKVKTDAEQAMFKAEQLVNQTRADEFSAKKSELEAAARAEVEAKEAAIAAEKAAAEAEKAAAEAPVVEAAAEPEVKTEAEAPAAEAKPETPAE